jgi:hypothetical protein
LLSRFSKARRVLRPMRPNPLTAMRVMASSSASVLPGDSGWIATMRKNLAIKIKSAP